MAISREVVIHLRDARHVDGIAPTNKPTGALCLICDMTFGRKQGLPDVVSL